MADYKRVICIGAHPLDAELMGGPMIIRYGKRGARCSFVHITKGRLTDPEATEEEKRQYEEDLENQMKAADKAMGGECCGWNYTSAQLPDVGEFAKKIAAYLKEEKADCVITHARGTLHPRHYYTYEAVTEAVRMLRAEGIRIQLYYGENCEDLAGFTPTVYQTMEPDEVQTWFNALRKYRIFCGGVNDMPYYEYYHSMGTVRAVEAGSHGFVKAYMHGALLDNE